MDALNYARRLEGQQQALKGVVRTLSSLRILYAEKLRLASQISYFGTPPMLQDLEARSRAEARISEAVDGINSLHACLGTSVVAHCAIQAFKAIPNADQNEALAIALTPLQEIVDRKVWSNEEREKLFGLCFSILWVFGDDYAHLIGEVQQNFPEETENIKKENT